MKITKQAFKTIIEQSVSKSEVCRKLGWHQNGGGLRRVAYLVEKWNIDIGHFSHKAAVNKFQRKWKLVKKNCPVCKTEFETKEGHPREQFTCSISCSNTHFRSGQNNPNWKDGYNGGPLHRRICFQHHEVKCIICGFDKVVDVHHLDENNKNNSPDNLVPLCPNHHKMYHSIKYKQEVLAEIQRIRDVAQSA